MKTLRPDFLIVGMERSGTLWTSAMLNTHPDIASFPYLPFNMETKEGTNTIGEVHFFNTLKSMYGEDDAHFVRPITDWLTNYNKVFAELPALQDKLPKEEFTEKAVRTYSDYCDKMRGEKKIVGESTPAYIFHLDFIDSLYPDIKKICSLRDPKDKLVSWHFNMLRKGKKQEEIITKGFALNYVQERIIPEYEALLEYEGDIYCVTYEAMSRNTTETIRGVVNYLGMNTGSELIVHMVKEGSFEEQSKKYKGATERKRGEEDTTKSIRKGIVGDWGNYVSSKLANEIDRAVEEVRSKVLRRFIH